MGKWVNVNVSVWGGVLWWGGREKPTQQRKTVTELGHPQTHGDLRLVITLSSSSFSSMPISRLEPRVQELILRAHPHVKTMYFNKGI